MNEQHTRKTILLVEDSKLLRTIVLDALKTAGYGTYEAGNGRDGLKSAVGVHPDVILLDVIMPIMNGVDMLKLLREDVWGKTVPVIMLTGEDASTLTLPDGDTHVSFVKKGDTMIAEVLAKISNYLPS